MVQVVQWFRGPTAEPCGTPLDVSESCQDHMTLSVK